MRFYSSLYLLIAAVYMVTASGRLGLSDSHAMFNVTQSILDEGSFSAEPCDPDDPGHPNHCVPGRNGRYYAGFGLVPSLLAVPALISGRVAARFAHVDESLASEVTVSLFTALMSPLTCVLIALWILKLGYRRSTAAFGACILAFASPYWHFGVKGFYSEPYFTLALLLAAYFLSSPRVRCATTLSGLALGAACGSRVYGVILFPAFIMALAVHARTRRMSVAQFFREAAPFSISFGFCVLLLAFANYARFGSPVKTGYHVAFPSASALFSTPLFKGMFELLFNGEVGLLVFAPWVVVALIGFPTFARTHLSEAVLCASMFLLNFLFFAKYDSWHAGWVAGPRMLTPTLPFLIVLMVPLIERLRGSVTLQDWRIASLRPLITLLLISGCMVQLLCILFPVQRYYALTEFYADKPTKPQWVGSIPLASIDFLSRLPRGDTSAAGPAGFVGDQSSARLKRASDSPGAIGSEEDFLETFPNPENLKLPDLAPLKMWLMRSPPAALYGYLASMILMGLVGLTGVKRYACQS